MSLSRKHYQAVAEILRTERQIHNEALSRTQDTQWAIRHDATLVGFDILERRLCTYFQADNPNFRPDTFRKAAQP